jgi:hypothetical protein
VASADRSASPESAASKNRDASQVSSASKDREGALDDRIADSDPSKASSAEGTPAGATPSEATSTAQSANSPAGKSAASGDMSAKPGEDQKTSPTATSPPANSVAKNDNDKPSAGTPSGNGTPQEGSPQNGKSGQNSQSNQGASKTASSSAGNSKPSDKAMAKDPEKPEEEKPASTTSNEGRLIASTEAKKDSDAQSSDANSNNNNSKSNNSNSTSTGNSQQPQQAGGTPKEQGDVAVPEGMEPLRNARKEKEGDSSEEKKKEEQLANKDSASDPGDSVTRRMFDVEASQSASSQRMQLKIDQWAGTFDGQRREKLAIAISPVLNQLDEYLEESEQITNNVAGRLEHGESWVADQQRLVDRAEKLLKKGEDVVGELQKQTNDTPYAFIGLQLSLIVQTHVTPARDSLWEAQQADGRRAELVRSAWQEITRARGKLVELTKTFERVHREHKLAEAAEKIKKMYRVFVEDSMAMLGPQKPGINDYERKMAEFELDDEYLKRLQEVLKMRRDLQAELAKLLTDDPRLMRRFMDGMMSRGDSLRDQLTLLSERQKQLAREVRIGPDCLRPLCGCDNCVWRRFPCWRLIRTRSWSRGFRWI